MADVLLQAQSNKPGAALLTLVSGESAGIFRYITCDLGNSTWDKQYSGQRGTQGAVLAGATAQNRVCSWRLEATGASQEALYATLSQLWQLDEELRRYGGKLTWRPQGGSFLHYITALDSGVEIAGYDKLYHLLNRLTVTFGVVSPPYMSGPPMDILDDFSSDTEPNYTFDTGSGADVVIASGQMTVTANPTTEKRMIHTGIGYSYGDVQAAVKATPGSTISSFLAGVVLKRIDASNYLRVYVDDNGTNSRLRIDKVVAGVTTNLTTTNLAARVVNGTAFWVRGRIEGINVFAEFFAAAPTPANAPNPSSLYTLSTAEQTTFGESVTGQAGIVWIPQQTAAVLDDFAVEPWTYNGNSLQVPVELSHVGNIPGDAPALAELYLTMQSGAAAAAPWAALGWWPKVGAWNRCWNGDFENTLLAALGWSVAAVANINGAATSIARITTAAKYGTCSGQIVCPATSGTGANFRIFRRFRKGITYTAEAWIHSAAGTTNTIIRVGNSFGVDTAQSANTPLSTTWQRVSITWTPTADWEDAYVALLITAATATTFEIDGVMVYEGTVAPASANQSEGRGGFPPIGLLEAENSLNGSTANANFRGAFGSTVGAGTGPVLVIDPSLLLPDDYTAQTTTLEVWARMDLVAGTPITAVLQAAPLTTTTGLPAVFSEEFGSVGKVIVMPSALTHHRFSRLGTLRLPTNAGRYLLSVGTNVSAFDYFFVLPATSRALSPSGRVNDSSYPGFSSSVGGEITRRIRADLSGTIKEPPTGAPESLAPSLGGSLLEFPVGAFSTAVKLSSLVPDDPTSNTSDESLGYNATVHFAVTPRWRLGRSV